MHLNGTSRSSAASIQAASSAAVGKRWASTPPVRSLRRSSAAATSSAAASQPYDGRLGLRQLDEDGHVVVEDPLAAGVVDGRDHPAGVAGEVVEVAQRDLEAGDVQAEAGGGTERPGHLARRLR